MSNDVWVLISYFYRLKDVFKFHLNPKPAIIIEVMHFLQ